MYGKYEDRYPSLERVAAQLQLFFKDLLRDLPRIDAISARAKSPDRFNDKAKRIENGELKYQNPDYEIQDQIGARVTVFYLSDVEKVRIYISKYLRYIEMIDKYPQSDSEFGYFGLHFILRTPEDVVPDDIQLDAIPEFFELQIKTLFQHAWSEAHHDLGYKSRRELNSDERRKVAFTAAQAWGADTIYEELAQTLVFGNN
jgi:ppGpp synthetase/RelA/SpoT-type nucleotidyltranferase